MERFCDDLRRERERQGVSLETISQITKVSRRHLLELEAGDYANLPGGVFRKGIVRSYLSTLQLDPVPWLHRFEQSLAALEQPPDTPESLAEFAENIRRNRGETRRESARWPGVVAMLLLLLVFGWCVWRFALKGHVLLTHRLPSQPANVISSFPPG